MAFINSSILKFSPDFQNTEEVSRGDLQESCSALINAVMKYLNFCSSGSKLETITCKFTQVYMQITLRHSKFSNNFTISAKQKYWKMDLDGCFWWKRYSKNFPEWLLLKDSCKDTFILEIITYKYFTFLNVTSC